MVYVFVCVANRDKSRLNSFKNTPRQEYFQIWKYIPDFVLTGTFSNCMKKLWGRFWRVVLLQICLWDASMTLFAPVQWSSVIVKSHSLLRRPWSRIPSKRLLIKWPLSLFLWVVKCVIQKADLSAPFAIMDIYSEGCKIYLSTFLLYSRSSFETLSLWADFLSISSRLKWPLDTAARMVARSSLKRVTFVKRVN